MSVLVKSGPAAIAGADAVAFVVYEDDKPNHRELKAADALVAGGIGALFAASAFKGEAERVLVHYRTSGDGPRRVIFVGGGAAAAVTEDTWRRAAAHAAKAAADLDVLAFVLRRDRVTDVTQASAAVEGARLARYKFDALKPPGDKRPPPPATFVLVVPGAAAARVAREAATIAEATIAGVVLARDLANLPGNRCRPADLADAAKAMARAEGLRCDVLDEPALRKLKMMSLLSVNRGSSAPPRFIVLEAGRKRPRVPTVCVVGKGITFDSGGISIKPASDMDKMRYDKSGGCATIGLLLTMARLKPDVHLVGIVAACENMPGNDATRPGDLVQAMNGKTIEILNTDAEGRLVLADALAYAREKFKPDLLVDIATLTGACSATFGPHVAGMLGTDEHAMREIQKAGEATYERVWPLPLYDEYAAMMRGTYGALKNIGGPKAGTITAAAFLKQFAEDTPWVHLDIAGTAYDDPVRVYNQGAGATGMGVRLLSRFLLTRYAKRRRNR